MKTNDSNVLEAPTATVTSQGVKVDDVVPVPAKEVTASSPSEVATAQIEEVKPSYLHLPGKRKVDVGMIQGQLNRLGSMGGQYKAILNKPENKSLIEKVLGKAGKADIDGSIMSPNGRVTLKAMEDAYLIQKEDKAKLVALVNWIEATEKLLNA